jgi:SCY1-like protein 2
LSALDFSTIKNEVFPVIATVFSKTSSLGIKIKGLEALRTLCGGGQATEDDGLNGMGGTKSKPKMNSVILDKYTIQEKVVPLLKAIKTKEPAVMVGLALFPPDSRAKPSRLRHLMFSQRSAR